MGLRPRALCARMELRYNTVIVTEWSGKKTALLFNHATRLMDQEPEGDNERKQKVDIVHQGPVVQNPN